MIYTHVLIVAHIESLVQQVFCVEKSIKFQDTPIYPAAKSKGIE